MPRLPIDYSKSVIYKIVCNDFDITDVYIGSTTNFYNRRHSHLMASILPHKHNYKLPVYQCIRKNGGFANWDMVAIEQLECKNKLELHTRERHYIELLKPNLNRQVPLRTIKEYQADNKEKIKTYQKQYNKKYFNKDSYGYKRSSDNKYLSYLTSGKIKNPSNVRLNKHGIYQVDGVYRFTQDKLNERKIN